MCNAEDNIRQCHMIELFRDYLEHMCAREISLDEAAYRWIQQGFAEKYRHRAKDGKDEK